MKTFTTSLIVLAMTAGIAMAATTGQLNEIKRYVPPEIDVNTLTNAQVNTILSMIYMDGSEGEKRGKVRAYLN